MQHGKSDSRPELRNLVPISMSVGWELSNRTQPRAVDRIARTRMICANIFMILLFYFGFRVSSPRYRSTAGDECCSMILNTSSTGVIPAISAGSRTLFPAWFERAISEDD
jgi:hypothetical protein